MTVDQVPANRRLVEELYAHGYLTATARLAALEFLNPRDQWGLWISRLFLVVGSALALSGVVYFFAFNWSQIPPIAKFVSIQIGIVAAVGTASVCGLTGTIGRVLMVGASVLVGVSWPSLARSTRPVPMRTSCSRPGPCSFSAGA